MSPARIRQDDTDEVTRAEVYKRLRQVGAFAKWKDAELKEFARRIRVRRFDHGDCFEEKQDPGDYLYMVATGSVHEEVLNARHQKWAEHTWTPNDWFVRQASYEGIFYESKVCGEKPGTLYVVAPFDLSWALNIQPDLWDLLRRDPIARRLRAMPVLATLDPEQIHRLARIAQVIEFAPGATICEAHAPSDRQMVYFIDWGQVALGQAQKGSGNVITAGNLFHNGPQRLGEIDPDRAVARTNVRLIAFSLSDAVILIKNNEGVARRLRRPPIQQFLNSVQEFKLNEEGLTEEQLDALASITSWEFYPAWRTVSLQGLRGDSLRILQRGAAVVRVVDAQGRERPRDFLIPGDYYGVGSLFRQDRHHATIRAVEPEDSHTLHGWLTSTTLDPEDQALQRHEPGATWLRICYDDLDYLLKSQPATWKNSALPRQLVQEVKKVRKYDWQEEDELIEYLGHRHRIILVGRLSWLLLIVAVMLLIDNLWRRAGGGFPVLGMVLFTLLALVPAAIWVVVDFFNDYFVVTNRRVAARERVVMIYESLNEAQLLAVQDTTIGVDFWGNVFGFGTLVVKTAAKSAWVIFDRIPKPRDVQRTITEQQQRVQAERRVEQREGLRQQITTDLRVGIVPQTPVRALPANLMATKPPSMPVRAWRRVYNFLDRTLFRAIEVVILRPIRAVVRLFKYGGRKTETGVDEFHGGFLACWWITPEKTVWRKHWWILIRNTWVSFLVWAAVFVLFFVRFSPSGPLPWWLVAFILGAVTFWLGWQYANWANDLYIVTNEKLVDIERLPLGFGEKRREGNLDRVQNVVLKIPNFWANLFGIGDVEIQTAATDEGFTFFKVADPRGVQREVWRRINLHQANRLRRESETMQSQQAMVLGVYHELMQETGKYKD